MRPFQTGLLLAAVLGASEAAFAETIYRSNDFQFQISQLAGWTAREITDSSDGARVELQTPNYNSTGGNCNVTVNDFAQLTGKQQSELDKSVRDGWLHSALEDEVHAVDPQGSIDWKDIVMVGAIPAQGAEMHFSMEGDDGGAVAVRSRKIIVVVPGRAYNVNCAALDAAFETEREGFDKVISSFRVTTN
jgi:hypothetical protein